MLGWNHPGFAGSSVSLVKHLKLMSTTWRYPYEFSSHSLITAAALWNSLPISIITSSSSFFTCKEKMLGVFMCKIMN